MGGHDEILHFVGRDNVGNACRFWFSDDGNVHPARIENMSLKEPHEGFLPTLKRMAAVQRQIPKDAKIPKAKTSGCTDPA